MTEAPGRQAHLCAQVRQIAATRHLDVQREVGRLKGGVPRREYERLYQLGLDRWDARHPDQIKLWRRHDELRESGEPA